MSKRNTKDKPITRGLALILAREILGPSAIVEADHEHDYFQVGIRKESGKMASFGGYSWDKALEFAKESGEAKEWQNYKDNRKNSFLEAVKSLRDTAREILGGKAAKLLTREEHRFVRNSLRGLA